MPGKGPRAPFFAWKLYEMQEICFEIVELETSTYHPLVKAEFKGLVEHWWVIDSGASKSIFDESLTDYYTIDEDNSVMATGLGKEVVETSSGTIAEFIIGGFNFGPLKIALVNFQHINDEYAKFSEKKIVGLIGCDFLFSQKTILDFEQKKIKCHRVFQSESDNLNGNHAIT